MTLSKEAQCAGVASAFFPPLFELTLCPIEKPSSRLCFPPHYADRFARRELPTRGCRQAGVAPFPCS